MNQKLFAFLVLILCVSCYSSLNAQNTGLLWARYLDNNSTFFDFQATLDGGFIAAGAINTSGTSFANENAWIVKTNDTGGVLWQKSYGGSAQDRFTQIIRTNDGGYLAAGFTASNDGDVSGNNGGLDYWVVKTDDTGAIQWSKCYGGSNHEQINTILYGGGAPLMAGLIKTTADGGYVLAGTTNSNDKDVSGYHGATHTTGNYRGDIWLIKIDSLGVLKWQKCIGGSMNEWPSTILNTADKGFVIAAVTSSSDGDAAGSAQHGGRHSVSEGGDYWVIKTDSMGTIEWQKCYGGSSYEVTTGMIACIEGGYLVAGSSYSVDGDLSAQIPGIGNNAKPWLVKIEETGSIEWEQSYWVDTVTNSFNMPNWETVLAIVQNLDGTFSTTLSSPQFYGMVKLDKNGLIRRFDLFTNNPVTQLYPSRLEQLADGSYVTIGSYGRAHTTLFSGVYVPQALIMKFEACPSYTYQTATICKGSSYTFGARTLTTAGIYWDTLSMRSGCDSLIRIELSIDSIEAPVITASDNTLGTGTYQSYQWLDDSNSPIAGATTQNYETTTAGKYRVVVTGNNGCTDTSAVYNHAPTDILEPIAFTHMKLYPNPATDFIHIELPGLSVAATLKIFSVEGRLVKTEPLVTANNLIPIQTLPAGIYLVKINSPEGTILKKIIKE